MKMNKNLCRWFGNMSLPALFSAVLLTSCGDELETDAYTGSYIRFSVSEEAEWRGTRAMGEPAENTLPRDSVQLLNGGDVNTPLYLHTLYTDSIATPASDSRADTAVLTRATPVKTATFYDSFGVLASAYDDPWDEASCLPDYMYDVEVTKASGWATSYHWPNLTKKMKFFAYAPYHGGGIVLSDKTTAGSPTITYTVPTAVADQKDLLVAEMDEQTGNTHTAVALTFDHALTAVKFVCGADMQGGTVKSVSLKNVFSKGIFDYATKKWSSVDTPVSFSQTLDKSTSGKPDEALTTDAQTFMMLPQTLPTDAQIEVVFTDNSGIEHTLTADIKGTIWPMGKTVIYKISSTSINWTYKFEVNMPGDFTYIGGTQPYSVISYKQNTKGKKESIAWNAQFSEDGGASWTDNQPAWLTAFTASGDGGENPQSCNATVIAQIGKDTNFHTQQLKVNPSQGTKASPYNLANSDGSSTNQNTANCYVVSAPGYYSFPLVYGNAIKDGATNTSAYTSTATGEHILTPFINHTGNPITDPYISKNAGCTPSRPELVWQDALNLVTDINYNNTGEGNISFCVDKNTIQQGNAVIAIKDAGGNVLWSWHIWVTDENINETIEVTNHQGKNYKLMPVNLGLCNGASKIYEERSCKVKFTAGNMSKEVTIKQIPDTISSQGNHPFYQWGRKDPFLPSNGLNNTNKIWYDKDGKDHPENPMTMDLLKNATCIKNYILNPGVMHNKTTCDNKYYNLWSANNNVTTANDDPVVKTIYDPSPVGFTLPPSNTFSGFTKTGDNDGASDINGIWDNFLKGWHFYTDPSKTKTIFFPASGGRDDSSGGLVSVGSHGFCWLSLPRQQSSACYLYFYDTDVNPLNYGNRRHGYGIRPSHE